MCSDRSTKWFSLINAYLEVQSLTGTQSHRTKHCKCCFSWQVWKYFCLLFANRRGPHRCPLNPVGVQPLLGHAQTRCFLVVLVWYKTVHNMLRKKEGKLPPLNTILKINVSCTASWYGSAGREEGMKGAGMGWWWYTHKFKWNQSSCFLWGFFPFLSFSFCFFIVRDKVKI